MQEKNASQSVINSAFDNANEVAAEEEKETGAEDKKENKK